MAQLTQQVQLGLAWGWPHTQSDLPELNPFELVNSMKDLVRTSYSVFKFSTYAFNTRRRRRRKKWVNLHPAHVVQMVAIGPYINNFIRGIFFIGCWLLKVDSHQPPSAAGLP